MRLNLPITETEFELNDQELIQTRTNSAGQITRINDAFVRVSGYGESELIGQPHNIVRHPDMPQVVFEDLWKTIQAGRIWSGYIKNRRKNGDFYWVKTDISPFRKHGYVIGYVSSRWKMSRAEIDQYEEIYGLIREGKAEGLVFREGKLEQVGIIEKLVMRLRR